jgi:hypothetical protein
VTIATEYRARTVRGEPAKLQRPGGDDLLLIRSYALRELEANEVRVFVANVANNQVDRDRERFSDEILQDFAQTLLGKSVLIGHMWGPPGVGRVYKSAIVEDGGWKWLRASFYMPELGNEKLINDVELGTASYVSIGFFAPDRVDVVGANGEVLFREYRRGPNGEKGEAIEMSFVFLGAQYDAAVIKSVVGGLQPKLRQADGVRSLVDALRLDGRCPPGWAPEGLTCRPKGAKPETVPPDDNGQCPEGYELGDDGLCHEKSAARAEPIAARRGLLSALSQVLRRYVGVSDLPAAGKDCGCASGAEATGKEEEMELKALEEALGMLTEQVKGLAAKHDATAAEIAKIATDIGELKGLKEQVSALGEQLAGLTEDVKMLEEAGMKALDRVERLEALAGAPKSAGEEGTDPPPKPGERPSARRVFGRVVLPPEFAGRR